MKLLLTITVLLMTACSGDAQGIFSQKAGQLKNLSKQIVLLKMYTGYLEKGYDIARKGLTAIGDIKKGDLNMHMDNFNSLKTVNPEITRYAKIAGIVSWQLQIVQLYKKAVLGSASSNLFSTSESDYVRSVFTNLLEGCAGDVDELISLTTSGVYEMKDDERLKRVDALETAMQDKYAFAQNFGADIQILSLQKNKVANEVQTARVLNNIKKP